MTLIRATFLLSDGSMVNSRWTGEPAHLEPYADKGGYSVLNPDDKGAWELWDGAWVSYRDVVSVHVETKQGYP